MTVYLLYVEDGLLNWIVLGVFSTWELAYNYIDSNTDKILDQGSLWTFDQITKGEIDTKRLECRGMTYYIEARTVVDK